ncbi:DNA-3-methyladenine glycosylase I [Oceanivirga miroungae]|uniref:DNA-3-methyladenine glycosylase 1 n=1 Tax=Oceanivirga miroungae TaxID=1130046 RepID=A0A6I8M929_9FUSO|nr:DNA-3-methyladenine glycosylase I [Oceanivirga miroungae]VWL84783.1 DNA-3-methyladenine glycosylase 1 [Oceanivirga miroungae]
MKDICSWALESDELLNYHNKEWCNIVKDDTKIFELLVLEFMQAGLSWNIILKKREFMRKEFDNFDYMKISEYSEDKIIEMLSNKNIIRNRLKIKALINNAKKFMEIQKKYHSFYNYIWTYTDFKVIKNTYNLDEERKSESYLSKMISKDLKKRGFKFLGSKVVYSFLEAIGVYNSHMQYCKYSKISNLN